MKPERWEEIKRLYHAARSLSIPARSEFFSANCGDPTIRMEVEALLKLTPNPPIFSTRCPPMARLSPAPVTQFGRYKVISKIAEGGMGAVYLAEDPRLGRKVAIKVLSADFLGDPKGPKRLEREAKAASALNHPNIMTIFEIGEDNGTHFIATEYIEGLTLREKLSRGPLP